MQLINAGGRRGGDGWVQQFGDYRKQDASANGATVSGTSYAIALGYDLPVSIIDALGLYLQMGFSAVNEKSAAANEITSDGISYGAYLSDKIGALQYELNAAYGFVDLESFRLVDFAGLVDRRSASWDATSTAASARLAYPILQDNHLLRWKRGWTYFNLEHDDYSEVETVGYFCHAGKRRRVRKDLAIYRSARRLSARRRRPCGRGLGAELLSRLAHHF